MGERNREERPRALRHPASGSQLGEEGGVAVLGLKAQPIKLQNLRPLVIIWASGSQTCLHQQNPPLNGTLRVK